MQNIKQGVLQANASVVSIIHRICDIGIIVGVLAFQCWLSDQHWHAEHLVLSLSAIVLYQMLAEGANFYRSWRGVGVTKEISHLMIIWSFSFFIVSLIGFYCYKEYTLSLYMQMQWYILTAAALSAEHFIIRVIIGALRARGYNSRNAVIVGATNVGEHLATQLINAPWLGLNVVGFYDDVKSGALSINETDIPILGELEQLVIDAKGGKIDRIYITLPMRFEQRIRHIVTELSDTTCSVLLVPDVFTFNLLNSRSQEINGIPLISIFDTPMIGVNVFIKRLEDILLASCILTLISPFLFFIGLAVKLTSPGPIIFKQQRYGIDGKSIEVWKFRSMTVMENGNDLTQAKKRRFKVNTDRCFYSQHIA